MICENCGKREANVRYTKIVNGNKQEYNLCEKCSKELGIGNMDFNMPISFSSFFSDFLEDVQNASMLPELDLIKQLQCPTCNLTFEEFMNTGKIGCSNCYDTFQEKIDPILKNMQGSNRHIGRLGEIKQTNLKENNIKENQKEMSELAKKKQQLKKLVKEEKYEEAAKVRDEIKALEDANN